MSDKIENLHDTKILSGTSDLTSGADLLEAAKEIDAPEDVRAHFLALMGNRSAASWKPCSGSKPFLIALSRGS